VSKLDLESDLAAIRGLRSPVFQWAILDAMRSRAPAGDRRFRLALAEAFRALEASPRFAYRAAYERARCLAEAGRGDEARQLFAKLFEDSLERDVFPVLDSTFREAFQLNERTRRELTKMLLAAASRLIDSRPAGRRLAVLSLAWQCRELGDDRLAGELLSRAFAGANSEENRLLRVAGFQYHWLAGNYAAAGDLLHELLATPELAGSFRCWRLAAFLAGNRGQAAESVACMDKALDIEFTKPPPEIDLAAVREDYGSLLGYYKQLAGFKVGARKQSPADLRDRIVSAADRWRSLDRFSAGPCRAAGDALLTLGERELAQDYYTTAITLRP
jgi:tetratricopeptide (TPR) repeat protein